MCVCVCVCVHACACVHTLIPETRVCTCHNHMLAEVCGGVRWVLDGCIVAWSGKSPTERSQWGYSIHDQYVA